MKKLLLSLLLLLTCATAHAGTGFEVGAVVDPMTELRNPVSGLAAVRLGNTRFGVSLGNNEMLSAMVDVIAINKQGLSIAVGVVADRLSEPDSFDSASGSDSLSTHRPHDSGHHYGDTHVRPGKGNTRQLSSYSRSLSLFGSEWGLSSSFSVSIPVRLKGFIESRVLFTAGEVSNRTSIGVRF
jgi:hypothetical protein